MSEEARDATFDIMKGIGILLMMAGHWPGIPQWLRQFIYSFHMPLFFLIAGYFSKPCKDGKYGMWIRKNARRLLLPFIVTQFFLIIWGVAQAFAKCDVNYIIRPSLSLIWGSCDVIDTRWGMVYVGPMWFLPALFWCKTFFELLLGKVHNWMLLFVCCVISVVSMVLHKYCFLPWGILQGLSCLTFMSLGYLSRQKLFPVWVYWLALACWPLAMFFSSLEVSDCNYRIYLLDVMGACGGTLFLWKLSGYFRSVSLSKPFIWLGVYSLVVLCFHDFEWFSSVSYSIVTHLPFDIHGNWMTAFRYVITIAFALLVVNVPFVKEVFGVQKN